MALPRPDAYGNLASAAFVFFVAVVAAAVRAFAVVVSNEYRVQTMASQPKNVAAEEPPRRSGRWEACVSV